MVPMPGGAGALEELAGDAEAAALGELDVDQVGRAVVDDGREVAQAEHRLVGHHRGVDRCGHRGEAVGRRGARRAARRTRRRGRRPPSPGSPRSPGRASSPGWRRRGCGPPARPRGRRGRERRRWRASVPTLSLRTVKPSAVRLAAVAASSSGSPAETVTSVGTRWRAGRAAEERGRVTAGPPGGQVVQRDVHGGLGAEVADDGVARARATRSWRSSTTRPRTTSASGPLRHASAPASDSPVTRQTCGASPYPLTPSSSTTSTTVVSRCSVRRSAVTNGVCRGAVSRWQRISVMLIEIRVGLVARPRSPGGRLRSVGIPDGYDEAHAAAERLAELTGTDRHDAVVVLGSGWGPAADAFGEPVASFPMTRLPGFHAPVAEGHRGEVAVGGAGRAPGAAVPRPDPPLRGTRTGRGRAPDQDRRRGRRTARGPHQRQRQPARRRRARRSRC